MHFIDWLVLVGFFAYTLWDGIKAHRKSKSIEGLLLGNRDLSWWAIGISVMATQASAITFIGTTGQAFMHDMRFIQVYLGLPIAMVILCITLIPLYYYSKAYTAYEVLEKRFGLRVRLSTSLMFLLSRGAALGIGMAAPAYVLSLILDIPLWITIMFIGIGTTFYTMFGGINGVIRTDVKQMFLVILGLTFSFFWIVKKLPQEVSFPDALHLAGALGKLETIDLEFNLKEKYNIWSGVIAGFFLMLAYFGTDHAQVQRYLTAKSLGDARGSILMSAFAKIPMQFFILLLGACLYVFYIFQDRPLLFIPDETKKYTNECLAKSREYEANFAIIHQNRKEAAIEWLNDQENDSKHQALMNLDQEATLLRHKEISLLESQAKSSRNDTNYVFPYFIVNELPIGFIGLILAAILAAALSSIDSMLNSLAAASIMDWYRRLEKKPRKEEEYLPLTRLATVGWGIFATISALAFGQTESIIEVINQISSYFFGPILGVFMLLGLPRVKGGGAFYGLIFGIIGVMIAGSLFEPCGGGEMAMRFPFGRMEEGLQAVIPYLWLNPLGSRIGSCFMVSFSPEKPHKSKFGKSFLPFLLSKIDF